MAKERLLIIGGSANGFGRETEGDAACYEMVSALLDRGIEVYLIDDNPYSFTASRTDIHVIVKALTAEEIVKVIIEHGITGIVPTVGGLTAVRLTNEVVKILGDQMPKVLGLSPTILDAAQNTKYLQERLQQLDLPAVQTRTASTMGEVFDAAREFDFPVVVRAIAPQGPAVRLQAEDAGDLDRVAEVALEQSFTHQVNVDKSIRGYREIALVVVRDTRGSVLMIGGIEDVDPVGIHSADSISVTPMQTLPDSITQKLRSVAFQIAHEFNIEGMLEVRFAVDPADLDYVVTRVVPYYDRKASLTTAATGYPLVFVMTGLMLGERIDRLKLPSDYAEHTAMIEPTMDHIAIRFPVFTFRELEAAGVSSANRLDTIQKSVGATIGVGRSVEEALEKAIRAAHFNNRAFSPTLMGALSDSELIEQIIYPHDNRILVLLEALRRGYTVDELAELTKIDAFYFYKFSRIMALEADVTAKPWDLETLQSAKYYGMSDGLIAKLWQENYESVRRFRWDNNILPTYKTFEPSAGEFEESVAQFYSTFEDENESVRLGQDTALVIGGGAFRLGDGAAASYVIASVTDELKRLGYQTVLMNNNPDDLSFIPGLSDKQYFEPLEISDIINVVEVEQPTRIFVAGNRIKLIKSLRAAGLNVFVIPRDKYLRSTLPVDRMQTHVNYFFDGQELYPVAVTRQNNRGLSISALDNCHVADIVPDATDLTSPGLYQYELSEVDAKPDIHPVSFTQVAFLEKVTGVAWTRLATRLMTGRAGKADAQLLRSLPDIPWQADAATLSYADGEFKEHLKINDALDNGRFTMAATYELADNGNTEK